jgi:hypothetical protein
MQKAMQPVSEQRVVSRRAVCISFALIAAILVYFLAVLLLVLP